MNQSKLGNKRCKKFEIKNEMSDDESIELINVPKKIKKGNQKIIMNKLLVLPTLPDQSEAMIKSKTLCIPQTNILKFDLTKIH